MNDGPSVRSSLWIVDAREVGRDMLGFVAVGVGRWHGHVSCDGFHRHQIASQIVSLDS